jgi:hypothetical protein
LHPIQALLAGNPPAISATTKEFHASGDMKDIMKHKDALLAAGMGFYRALNKDVGVIFNALHINEADLRAADQQGKLGLLAPNYHVVDHAASKAGLAHPALSQTGVPGGFKPPQLRSPPQLGPTLNPPQLLRAGGINTPPPIAPPPQQPDAKPAPASAARQIMAQRISGMNPGAPTSGPQPGAGRLLNQILRPAV